MKKLFAFTLALPFFIYLSHAQTSTAEEVYSIFQARCASCHGNNSPAGGLDLVGTGNSVSARMNDVRGNLFNVNSSNVFSATKGYKRIDSGDSRMSTLFRKVNTGLQADLVLSEDEGDNHEVALAGMLDREKEMIRQWIIYGAPLQGQVIDPNLLVMYYDEGKAVGRITEPPAVPDPSEGFQIHLGPFFLEPEGEEEFYWKYDPRLEENVEITGLDMEFGSYSHHFILYNFQEGKEGDKPFGLREDNAHSSVSLVTAAQFAEEYRLPKGSAYKWPKGTHLDLNTHYINYSPDKVAACEVYVNIYTQEDGIAKQEMETALIPNLGIFIPNDGERHDFSYRWITPNVPFTVYIWQLGSHTHQWGTDFDVFTLDAFRKRDEHIFDASHKDGDPMDLFIGYDYQHPPIRYFGDFLPLRIDHGLEFEASYVNTGPNAVRWGDTSDDEMMLIVVSYMRDITGVEKESDGGEVTSIEDGLDVENRSWFHQDLTNQSLTISARSRGIDIHSIVLRNIHGQRIDLLADIQRLKEETHFILPSEGLAEGVYVYQLLDRSGAVQHSGKILLR